jgi:hypothetical protein
MRLISFPGAGSPGPHEDWNAELEAALDGLEHGPEAESWRDLRDDVRALADPIDPEFERRLHERLTQPRADTGEERRPRWWSRLGQRRGPLLGAAGALATVAAALLIAAPWRAGTVPVSGPRLVTTQTRTGAQASSQPSAVVPAEAAVPSPEAGPATPAVQATGAPASGRVQQLGASISLSTAPEQLQSTADAVAQVAARAGGFVASSHVQSEKTGGEAALTLSVPSARLNDALASIGRLADVQSESRSLQDITDEYGSARRRLADLQAERAALLKALAAATTEGQIASLRERLAASRGAIAAAEHSLQAITHRAATAEVEVTITGNRAARHEGATVGRGLHDAERVLLVAFDAALVAAAALIPLALFSLAVLAALRAWRRFRRESVLDAGGR